VSNDRPLVVFRPYPVQRERIFTAQAWQRLQDTYRVVDLSRDDSDEAFAAALPEAFAVIGQPALDAEAIDRATELRCVLNVEGNFFPNVDYAAAHRQGVYILGCGPAYAQAVAEYSLGLALDLCRGISREDRRFRAGTERYAAEGCLDSILLDRADIGFVGYGLLGRATHRLLEPFRPTLRVFDPWVPDAVVEAAGAVPGDLAGVLAASRVVFVFATVTAESERMLGAEQLAVLPDGARVVVVSRAAVLDLDALVAEVDSGRLLAAVDVWPEEPVPADAPVRDLDGLVLSAHRAGGIPAALLSIGDMVLDDLDQIRRGLPPMRMQVAARELVGRYRNRPVALDG
jgi:phosphoglycerate dehydrogenase-like enzyme